MCRPMCWTYVLAIALQTLCVHLCVRYVWTYEFLGLRVAMCRLMCSLCVDLCVRYVSTCVPYVSTYVFAMC